MNPIDAIRQTGVERLSVSGKQQRKMKGKDMQRYRLHYREPGKRAGTTRWAKPRPVDSVQEAIDWMNANKDSAFLPASVMTPGNQWQRPEVVAILGDSQGNPELRRLNNDEQADARRKGQ